MPTALADLIAVRTDESGRTEYCFAAVAPDSKQRPAAPPPGTTPLGGGWPLAVRNDPKGRGRYLVASRALRAGELVCAEDPFAQTVHDALHDVVCHHCYDVLNEGRVLFDGAPLEPRQPSSAAAAKPLT